MGRPKPSISPSLRQKLPFSRQRTANLLRSPARMMRHPAPFGSPICCSCSTLCLSISISRRRCRTPGSSCCGYSAVRLTGHMGWNRSRLSRATVAFCWPCCRAMPSQTRNSPAAPPFLPSMSNGCANISSPAARRTPRPFSPIASTCCMAQPHRNRPKNCQGQAFIATPLRPVSYVPR